jgi:hypothetical protein
MKVTTLTKTCIACPAQWEGKTDDDRSVYVKYRWGGLKVNVSEPGKDIWAAVDGKEVLCLGLTDEPDGWMENEELKPLLIEHGLADETLAFA